MSQTDFWKDPVIVEFSILGGNSDRFLGNAFKAEDLGYTVCHIQNVECISGHETVGNYWKTRRNQLPKMDGNLPEIGLGHESIFYKTELALIKLAWMSFLEIFLSHHPLNLNFAKIIGWVFQNFPIRVDFLTAWYRSQKLRIFTSIVKVKMNSSVNIISINLNFVSNMIQFGTQSLLNSILPPAWTWTKKTDDNKNVITEWLF